MKKRKVESNREYEVEGIIDDRIKKVKIPRSSRYELRKEYLLKWKGFKNPSWEPEENLLNCQQLLKEYLKKTTNNEHAPNIIPTNEQIMDCLHQNKQVPKKSLNLLNHKRDRSMGYSKKKYSALINSQNIINNINIEKIKEDNNNSDEHISIEEFCAPAIDMPPVKKTINNQNNYFLSHNYNTSFLDIDNIKIIDVVGVRFPKNNSESVQYKVRMNINGKNEIKMIKKENNIISNDLLVTFYEKMFGYYHKGQYFGN